MILNKNKILILIILKSYYYFYVFIRYNKEIIIFNQIILLTILINLYLNLNIFKQSLD